jgi:DNA-binding MarR family transcriptional regulator
MIETGQSEAVNDFLGSAQVFVSAVSEAVDAKVLAETAGKEFTLSQLKLLRLVSLMEDHSIGDVAAFLGVSNAAASKAVDRLVQRMYLRRAEGERDRRVIHLSLTEAGRRVLHAFDAARAKQIEALFGGLSDEELRQSSDLLQKLSARIVDQGLSPEETCLQCGVYFRDRCVIRERIGQRCNYLRYKARKQSAGAPARRST